MQHLVIEDTAVDVQDLPDFIAEFNVIMEGYGQKCVHYAHAGSVKFIYDRF